MVCLSRQYHFNIFKGCLPQIFLGPLLNSLSQIFFKIGYLKKFAKNTCATPVSFLIKLRAFRAVTLLTRDYNIGVFLWNLENFWTFFYRTPPTSGGCFWTCKKSMSLFIIMSWFLESYKNIFERRSYNLLVGVISKNQCLFAWQRRPLTLVFACAGLKENCQQMERYCCAIRSIKRPWLPRLWAFNCEI